MMELLEFVSKIYELIDKAINWLFDKIPFLKKALKFVEDLVANILLKPLEDCKKSSGFQFQLYSDILYLLNYGLLLQMPDFQEIVDKVGELVNKGTISFNQNYVDNMFPNFIPFMNCLKNKVANLISQLGNLFKAVDFINFAQIAIGSCQTHHTSKTFVDCV